MPSISGGVLPPFASAIGSDGYNAKDCQGGLMSISVQSALNDIANTISSTSENIIKIDKDMKLNIDNEIITGEQLKQLIILMKSQFPEIFL